jgi:hypothetical protein
MAIGQSLAKRHGVVVMAAATAVFAGAMGALVPTACSSTETTVFVPGPQGVPSIAIVKVGPVDFVPDAETPPADVCIPIGTDPDAQVPVAVQVAQVDLRPPGIVAPGATIDTPAGPVLIDAGYTDGSCSYGQCGHLVLSLRDADDATASDVFNNAGAATVIPILMRKLAERDAHLIVTVQVVNDANGPVQHNGVPVVLKTSVTIRTRAVCGDGGAGGAGGAAAASASMTASSSIGATGGGGAAASGAGGAGGSGGAGGQGGAAVSGGGGAGGATGSGGGAAASSGGGATGVTASSSATTGGAGGAGGAIVSSSAISSVVATGVGGAIAASVSSSSASAGGAGGG